LRRVAGGDDVLADHIDDPVRALVGALISDAAAAAGDTGPAVVMVRFGEL
jgi:hypothetical protein